MARRTGIWPENLLDPRIADPLLAGSWAGLGAAFVGYLLYLIAHLHGVQDLADVTVHGLWLAAIGVGLGPAFAWLTGRLRVPLLPAGLLLGVVLAVVAREWTLAGVVPILVYGATLGLLLRYLRNGGARGGRSPPST